MGQPFVVMVNQTFATRFFQAGGALGQRIRLAGQLRMAGTPGSWGRDDTQRPAVKQRGKDIQR